MFWRTLYLDEFQHIRLEGISRQPASRRSGMRLSKRDELLKRDRQLSLRTPISGFGSKLAPEIQPDDRSPARTPPPTSLFLPMQLSNSKEPKAPRAKTKPCDDSPPKLGKSPKFMERRALARLEQPKTLPPRLSAGRSAFGKSLGPPAWLPQKARQTVGRSAYRPLAIFCQRTFTKKIFPCGLLKRWRGVSRAFSCLPAGAA
jgi:hypothetical protein